MGGCTVNCTEQSTVLGLLLAFTSHFRPFSPLLCSLSAAVEEGRGRETAAESQRAGRTAAAGGGSGLPSVSALLLPEEPGLTLNVTHLSKFQRSAS